MVMRKIFRNLIHQTQEASIKIPEKWMIGTRRSEVCNIQVEEAKP